MTTDTLTTTQIHRVFIKAPPRTVWEAITRPEWTARYGWGGRAGYELQPGGAYRMFPSEAAQAAAKEHGFALPDVIIDGEVLEADPPYRLVQTWRRLMDPETAKEGFTRLTFEILETSPGITRLTVIHELEGAPKLAVLVAGEETGMGGNGWPWLLSDLKTLLESGSPMIKAEWLES
jgi:uncharacterized protein YndB with AHSA1/START domain